MLGNDFRFYTLSTNHQSIYAVINFSDEINFDISNEEGQKKIANRFYNSSGGYFHTSLAAANRHAANLQLFVILCCKNLVANDEDFIKGLELHKQNTNASCADTFIATANFNRSHFFRPENCQEILMYSLQENKEYIVKTAPVLSPVFIKQWGDGMYGREEQAFINTHLPCSLL